MWPAASVRLLSSVAMVSLAAAETLPNGVISIPLQRIKDQTAYGVDVGVGTPHQNVVLLVDTGSASIGMESKWNYACQEGNCQQYGMYENSTSSTSVYISAGYFDMVGDHGSGSFINDTVRFGGASLEDFYFGTIEAYSGGYHIDTQQAGFFGLGAVCRSASCDAYPTVVQQLYDRGIISRRAFSLYLGPDEPDAKGTLLIGGVDEAKRRGPVYKTKMRPDASGQPNKALIQWFELRGDGEASKTVQLPNDSEALWDSGTPHWYMPQELFEAIGELWGLAADAQPEHGRYEVDCKHRRDGTRSVAVGLENDGSIEIPLHHLVSQAEDGSCFTHIAPYGLTLGDPFLRGVYVTFDYDNLTLEYSGVRYTDETDIRKIE